MRDQIVLDRRAFLRSSFALTGGATTVVLANPILPPLNPGAGGALGANNNSLTINGSGVAGLTIAAFGGSSIVECERLKVPVTVTCDDSGTSSAPLAKIDPCEK